jgi:O-antigen ligase
MKLRFFALLASVTLLVIPSWLDPINLPKLLCLLTLAPLIAWQPILLFWKNRIHTTVLQKLLLFAFAGAPFALVSAALANGLDLQSLFGAWGRNNGILSIVALILVAIGALYLAREEGFFLSFLRFASLLIAISGIYGLLQLMDLDPIVWVNSGPKLIGLFGNSNFASSIWALGSGFSLFACLFSKKLSHRIILAGNSIFLAFTSIKSESIQGPLLVLIFTLTAIYIFSPIKHKIKTVVFLSISTFGFVIFVAGIFGNGPIGSSLRSNSVIARFNYWEAAWNMLKANPFFGVGVDGYGEFYRSYRSDGAAASLTIDITTNNAHNAILHLLATVGIIGVFPIFLIFAATSIVSIRSILRFESSLELKTASTLFFGTFLMSLFSIDNLAVAIWIWTLAGIVLGLSIFSSSEFNESKSKVSSKNKSRSEFNTPLVASLLSAMLFIATWSFAFPDRKLVEILNTPAYSNDLNSLDLRRDRLIELSESIFFNEQHAIISMQALNEIGKPSDAIDLGKKQMSEVSGGFALLNYIAYLLEETRRYPEAIEIRQRQIALDKRHGGVWLAIAFDAREAGMQELSESALRNARLNSKYMGENFELRIKSFFPGD